MYFDYVLFESVELDLKDVGVNIIYNIRIKYFCYLRPSFWDRPSLSTLPSFLLILLFKVVLLYTQKHLIHTINFNVKIIIIQANTHPGGKEKTSSRIACQISWDGAHHCWEEAWKQITIAGKSQVFKWHEQGFWWTRALIFWISKTQLRRN